MPKRPQLKKTGDLKEYMTLVIRIARRIARRLPPSVSFEDLVSAGNLGLVEASQRYDGRLNDNFAAYAEIRIRGAILDEVRAMDWMPRAVRRRSRKLDRAQHYLTGILGRPPEQDELAQVLKLDERALGLLRQELRNVVLLEGEELDRSSRSSTLGPASQLLHRERVQKLAMAIDALPARERQVIALYYLENLKLREIGDLLGVTESRVCQLHTRALTRLRDILSAKEAADAIAA